MKYKTFMIFRNLAGLGVAGVAAVGAFIGCRSMAKDTQTVPFTTVSAPPASVSPTPPTDTKYDPKTFGPITKIKPGAPGANAKRVGTTVKDGVTYTLWSDNTVTKEPSPTDAVAVLSARDKEVIDLRKQPLANGKKSGDSTKWVAVGNGFKAEFRADSGSSAWDRVKIDLNNNKKWDERWDFKGDGSIKRRISPTDDDSTYSTEYHLNPGETKWMRVK